MWMKVNEKRLNVYRPRWSLEHVYKTVAENYNVSFTNIFFRSKVRFNKYNFLGRDSDVTLTSDNVLHIKTRFHLS